MMEWVGEGPGGFPLGAKSKISVVLSVVDKLRLQFSLGSPIAIIVGLTDKENGGYFHWVEGDDPNESTMKVALQKVLVDTSYPHRKLTLFHTHITGGCYSRYHFGCWRGMLKMGMKVEGAGKKRLFAIGSPLYQALATTDSLPLILTPSMIAGLFGNPFATSWTFILCSVVFQLPYSLDNQGYRSSVVTFTKGQPLLLIRCMARRSFAAMPFLATVIAAENKHAVLESSGFS
ncbi:hypothetical protein MLD38_040518 [Melastoma candidum]|nr:hypothetical protein MLD38_040518 [Melastoma candidum]